jgi:hypothetical protein
MTQFEDFDDYYMHQMNECSEEPNEEIMDCQENNSIKDEDKKEERKINIKKPISKRLIASKKRYHIYPIWYKKEVLEDVNNFI